MKQGGRMGIHRGDFDGGLSLDYHEHTPGFYVVTFDFSCGWCARG